MMRVKAPPPYTEQTTVEAQVVTTQPQYVITTQYAQKSWKVDYRSLSWCDGHCCSAFWCPCCAHGSVSQMSGGGYGGPCCLRFCFGFIAVFFLVEERERMRQSQQITDPPVGCCTVFWCESCILASMLYEVGH
ncbi:Oidioi.mRNA.OKI2018_I69.XSR.g16845.t1.cds [Oikopleura dioica]|uniref:Oidioi.mRNA.OKI2018_I69.XSR.g16845.t1.cds n=1 Tax=Oikopleura dioica TaxID=34765 RepID=A0ABN7SRR8_OIKDI|nr:Oidioi.mRNA.OKI2018_I69.XSR.g16845.t1.cds [Oikopleura dioica]